jgi:hypothetical protein
MMTNTQLWLSIGIPSLLIVLSWINNNSRFDRIEKRLDAHDAKFDQIDRRFLSRSEELERRFVDVDKRFQAMDRRFDAIIDAVHSDTLEIMRSMTALHERVAVVEARQNR